VGGGRAGGGGGARDELAELLDVAGEVRHGRRRCRYRRRRRRSGRGGRGEGSSAAAALLPNFETDSENGRWTEPCTSL
jgi:hypothetical protein